MDAIQQKLENPTGKAAELRQERERLADRLRCVRVVKLAREAEQQVIEEAASEAGMDDEDDWESPTPRPAGALDVPASSAARSAAMRLSMSLAINKIYWI